MSSEKTQALRRLSSLRYVWIVSRNGNSGFTQFQLFDVGGSLSHMNSRGVFYQQANGIILVHDCTNRKSHENLKNWLLEILSKEGKDTIKTSAHLEQELDSEQFLGSCQVRECMNVAS